jgi:Tfp pilus assembly protein PilV
MNQQNQTSSSRAGEKGFSLVEALIGLIVLTIVVLTCAQLFRVHVEHLALADRSRRADVQANASMNTLASFNFSALPDSNPFTGKGPNDPIADGEQVSLNSAACLAQANCEQIIRWPQTSSTASDYVTISWNQPRPTGPPNAQPVVVYYRAWRVTTLDAAKGLRRITLVILPAEPNKAATDPIEPLALRQTNVVQRQ